MSAALKTIAGVTTSDSTLRFVVQVLDSVAANGPEHDGASPRPNVAGHAPVPVPEAPRQRATTPAPFVQRPRTRPARSATPSIAASSSSRNPSISRPPSRATVTKQRHDEVKNANGFWRNRLAMLRREVERSQMGLDRTRAKGSAAAVSSVMNETVSAQIELERQRNLHHQAERRQAIRLQTLEHKVATRNSQRRLQLERAQIGVELRHKSATLKQEAMQQREEERERKSKLRAAVQADRLHAMVARVQGNALRREEARLSYEASLSEVEHRTETIQNETYEAMAEASALVDRIRALKALKGDAEANRGALRSLHTGVYVE